MKYCLFFNLVDLVIAIFVNCNRRRSTYKKFYCFRHDFEIMISLIYFYYICLRNIFWRLLFEDGSKDNVFSLYAVIKAGIKA